MIAWLLVLPCAAWVALRAFGLERGYPLVPLLSYTPLAVAGAATVAALMRGAAPAVVALALTVAATRTRPTRSARACAPPGPPTAA